jgi:GDP-L-fucose synthase
MLYFGSGAEFDKRGEINMINEKDAGNGIPVTDYGLYKYIINNSIQHNENIYNLRVFGLFGKYENWKRTFISGACCKALKNLPITIRQNVYFDYLYIDDFCKIVKWFINHDVKHRAYNVTSGKRIDLLTISNILKEVSQKKLPIYVCKEGLANEYSASNQRLLNEMRNFTFTPMEDAIRELYVWYKNHEEDIDIYSLLYQ